jgi:tRNA modification GTPase
MATICACATAIGGDSAVIRLAGPAAFAIAHAAALPLPPPWTVAPLYWPLAGGACPCRVLALHGPRTSTGGDLIEITLPGSPAVVALALDALLAAGAAPAPPGGFTRQALAHGRLTLDQAEAVLAMSLAGAAASARAALARLRPALAQDVAEVRARLIALRALVEAGLDFLDEEDVRAYDPAALRGECAALAARLGRWRSAALAAEGVPLVCLAGPANAGKSALFTALGGGPALVSAVPGTTRDALEAEVVLGGRQVRLVDTAGWLDAAMTADDPARAALDRSAIQAGADLAGQAALVLLCSAPDAPLPPTLSATLPANLPAARTLVVATKADLAPGDTRAALAVSAHAGAGLDALGAAVAARLAATGDGEPRQQRLLAATQDTLTTLAAALPADVLLAEDLRAAADRLGDLIGATTADDVLDAIFARFCIGK